MKSLDQIEARTPISSLPYTISTPGSYYLTANMTVTSGSAITITASQVTLDLNGFTLSSTEASPTGAGVLLAGGDTDITILNGHIKGSTTYSGGNYSGGPGFAYGIYYSGSAPVNVRVSGVSVSGCSGYGIYLGIGSSTVVDSCTLQTVGGYGIEANTVSRSTANYCGNVAIVANIASDSYAYSTGSSEGMSADISANNCYGFGTGIAIGLYAANAVNCTGQSTGNGQGLYAVTANNCQGQSGSGTGLYAVTANNCQGQSGSGIGLYATQTATGCYGTSSTGVGLHADEANNCKGISNGNSDGLDATTAMNCKGQSGSGTGLNAATTTGCYGLSSSGDGLIATATANNCYGQSSSENYGLSAILVINCYGKSSGGTGLYAAGGGIAIGCFGDGYIRGLLASMATGCYGSSSTGTGFSSANANFCFGSSVSVTGNKYNMP